MQLRGYNRIFILVLIVVFNTFSVPAQSRKELEKQRIQTLEKLESTNKMLKETKNSQRSSLNKLTIIKKSIKERKNLIKNISEEINHLDNEMDRLNSEKMVLDKRLRNLKADYARLVQEAHINRSIYSKIMFVLSAKTFNQSYRRLRYLQEFSDYRKQQAYQIEDVKMQISEKSDSLNENKITKVKVVKQKETEAQALNKDQQKENNMLTDLNKKEKKLRSDLKKQQQQANALNKKIEALIAEEIRKAEAKRLAEAKKRAAENKAQPVDAKTKEEQLISGNFAANKGRLPWPTEKGFISGRYGVQPHPVLKHVETNNKGIYIQTTAKSNARAVFEGVVTQRFSIPGSNNAVIVQHGDYRTVYANLTDIYVTVGEKIKAKQSIGRIFTDDESDNKTELYFQVWKGRDLMNPEQWIVK